MFAYSAIAVILLGLFLLVYMRVRDRGTVTILDYFVFFFLMQWGPQACFDHPFRLKYDWVSGDVIESYYIGIALMYAGLSVGLILAAHFFGRNRRESIGGRPIPVVLTRTDLLVLSIVVLAYSVGFVVLGGGSFFARLSTYLDFTAQTTLHSYTEIRRELFVDTPIHHLTAATRYFTTPILFAVTIVAFLAVNGAKQKIVLLLLCVVLFVVCAIDLKKLVYAYYVMLGFAVVLHYRFARLSQKLIVYLAGVAATLSLLLIGLYLIQYDALRDDGWNEADASSLLFYRTFLVASDDIVLQFELYPDILPYTDINNIGLLSSLFGSAFRDVPTELATHYYGTDLTTVQSGFLSSSHASFGSGGIFISSVLVSFLLVYLVRLNLKIRSPVLRIAFSSVVGLNTYLLTASPLHTALLSGGVLSTPFLIFLVDRLVPGWGVPPRSNWGTTAEQTGLSVSLHSPALNRHRRHPGE